MSVLELFTETKNTLVLFWQRKIFRIAIFIQIVYLSLSIVLFFLLLSNQNDFIIFYESSKLIFTDIGSLYDQTKYLWDFRYFPLSAFFFIPFSILDFEASFVIFNILNFFINILIILLLYKIIILVKGKDHERDNKRVILYISLYLMAAPHILNYIHGQINLYVTFFILASLLIFLSRNSNASNFLASLILGISIIIKPTTVFLVPFLLLIRFDLKTKKFEFNFIKSFIRILGLLLPVSLNFIFFFLYPRLWNGFLATNFTGSNASALNFSFSLTKLIINFCFYFNLPYSQLWVLITIVGITGILGFSFYVIRKKMKHSIIYGYTLGILIMFLTYFDTWDHHLLNLIPLLIIIIFNLPRKEIMVNLFKRGLFFFNFLDIVFIGAWFLIYVIFPFNFLPTIVLTICLYGVFRVLTQNLEKLQGEVTFHEI
jgi:hypothetical protein